MAFGQMGNQMYYGGQVPGLLGGVPRPNTGFGAFPSYMPSMPPMTGGQMPGFSHPINGAPQVGGGLPPYAPIGSRGNEAGMAPPQMAQPMPMPAPMPGEPGVGGGMPGYAGGNVSGMPNSGVAGPAPGAFVPMPRGGFNNTAMPMPAQTQPYTSGISRTPRPQQNFGPVAPMRGY